MRASYILYFLKVVANENERTSFYSATIRVENLQMELCKYSKTASVHCVQRDLLEDFKYSFHTYSPERRRGLSYCPAPVSVFVFFNCFINCVLRQAVFPCCSCICTGLIFCFVLNEQFVYVATTCLQRRKPAFLASEM